MRPVFLIASSSRGKRRGPISVRAMAVISGGLALLGVGFLIGVLLSLISTLSFLPGSVSANGTIIHCTMIVTTQTNNNGTSTSTLTCQPTVRFRTSSGQQITITSSSSSSNYQIGDVLPVRYHPTTPQDARLADFVSIWLLPLIFGVFSLICLIASLVVFRALRKRRSAASTGMVFGSSQ